MKKIQSIPIYGLLFAFLIILTLNIHVAGEDPKETPTPTPTETPPDPTPTPTATPDPKDPCEDCESKEDWEWLCINCKNDPEDPDGVCLQWTDENECHGCSFILWTWCEDENGEPYWDCCDFILVDYFYGSNCSRPLLPNGWGDCECDTFYRFDEDNILWFCEEAP